MKKLSKRQKLIGGIAIILIAVILAIFITTSIVKNNNQVASEGYSATTANAGSSLVASYIKKGITIGGITGTLETLDTNDATAYAEDIAYGKIAYARGERIVGKMNPPPIENTDLNIYAQNVYYADLDSTGEISVDGVIFADLAGEEESGQWRRFLGSLYDTRRNKFKAILYKRRIYRRALWNRKSNSPSRRNKWKRQILCNGVRRYKLWNKLLLVLCSIWKTR